MEEEQPKAYFAIFNICKSRQNPPLQTTSQVQENGNQPGLASNEGPNNPDQPLPQKTMEIESSKAKNGPNVSEETSLSRNGTTPTNRTPNKSAQRHDYSKEDDAQEKLRKAVESYKNRETFPFVPGPGLIKKSLRSVSEYYQIPKSTLSDYIKGKSSVDNPPQIGRKPIFSDSELADIVNHLLKMAEVGYGYTSLQMSNLIRFIAEKCKQRKDLKIGSGFVARLFVKFPELSLRKVTTYDYLRAAHLTPEIVMKFFNILDTAYNLVRELSGNEIDPRNIWSVDEVGFKLNDQKNLFIVTKKGTKNANLITTNDSSHISVIFCCNAAGYSLPPFFVVKGKPKGEFLDNCRKAGFRNSQTVGTKTAFITFPSFLAYCQFFVQEAKFNEHAYSVLIMDGHRAHTFNLDALQYLNQKKVFAVSIPSHTSHIFNVGDRTVFGNMKKSWRESCLNYFRATKKPLTSVDFPFIFKEVWDKSLSQVGIIKGKFYS